MAATSRPITNTMKQLPKNAMSRRASTGGVSRTRLSMWKSSTGKGTVKTSLEPTSVQRRFQKGRRAAR